MRRVLTSHRLTAFTAAAVGSALLLGGPSPARADDDSPSRNEVETARATAADKAQEVGAIKARLAAAEQRVEDLGYAAAEAAETYNGAVYRLSVARKEAERTQRRADRAAADAAKQRRKVAAMTVQAVQQGSDLNRMSVLFDGAGPAELLDQNSAYDSTNEALQAELEGYQSQRTVAGILAGQALDARDQKRGLATDAADAKAAADAAVTASEQAAAGIAERKRTLVTQLADAQGISLRLAEQRQAALRRQARERARTEAAAEAAAARRKAARQAVKAAQAAAHHHSSSVPDGSASGASSSPSTNGSSSGPEGSSSGASPSRSSGDSSSGGGGGVSSDGGGGGGGSTAPTGGAALAIAFAKAQIGEPYVWGAAGPSSWDCSGLTMGAWAKSGVSLPHYSVAQYAAIKHVSVGSIRRGDLVFWSRGSASSIYHVAIYAGGGMVVDAPRPGRTVEYVSINAWIRPDLAGRP